MRLLVLFLVCSIGLTYAADSYAQKALISIDVRNQRVEDVLKEIEAQSDFDFFFNNKHVDLNRRVSISADKSNIFSVLKEVFAGTNVIYSVLDKKIILSVKAQLPQQDKKVIVSGTVLDVQGDPIIGASVSEKDVLENGTITDMNGFFKLSVSSSKARLQISYLGYQTQIARVSVGKQIAIAVKAGGPEPENNPTLRSVIATCKRENMPKDNIERAIKNALGKDQSDYKSMTYEGYGPHGIAVFVDTLTDNTTRTVADVRSVFNKFGGNLGTMGSLAFLFDHKCMFTFKIKEGMDMEELILDLIDYDVEDEYEQDDEEGTITIYGDPKSYAAIQKHLEECGFEDVGGDFTYIPNDLKDVTPEQRETLDKMIERLEEFDDVQTVYTNMKPEGGEEE